MQTADNRPGRERTPGETQGEAFSKELADEAHRVAVLFAMVWADPQEQPPTTEYKAMWYATHLIYDCKVATKELDGPQRYLREFVMVHDDPVVRYDVETALTTLVGLDLAIEPFMNALRRIRTHRTDDDLLFDPIWRALREQEPDAMARWHAWLWPSHGSPTDHGDASILAIAAERLADGLATVLGYEFEPVL